MRIQATALLAAMFLAAGCSPAGGSSSKKADAASEGTSTGFGEGTGDTEGTAGTGTETGTGTGTTDSTDTGPAPDTGPAGLACGGPGGSGDADCPVYLPKCGPAGICVECLSDAECSPKLCFDGRCLACQNGNQTCSSNKVVQCNEQNTGFDVVEECPAGGTCNAGKCFTCYPSTKKCEGSLAWECTPAGDAWTPIQDCAQSGLQCHLGVCLSPCGSDFKANTNAGCGFYAVDLDNAIDSNGFETLDAFNAQFAVVVSNTSETATAEVTVSQPGGQSETKPVTPRSLQTFLLPPTFGLDNTGKGASAFKVDSTQPITVYQFNPLSNEGVFSNDASVLLPADGLGKEYYALSHKQIQSKFRGFVTVVGISEATTQVSVTPTTQTLAGGGIPAIGAGETHTFSIEQGDVVNIESDQDGGDLTGTHVLGDGPIAVFSGHEAAVTSDQCCADHLEQQMVPVAAWGMKYVLTRSMERGLEKDYFRIVASEDGTTVQVNPAVMSPPVKTLNAGQFIEFATSSSFTVNGDKPIMVGQLLASSFEVVNGSGGGGFCSSAADCPPGGYTCFFGECVPPSCGGSNDCPSGHTCYQATCAPIGDPALILGVPVEQWRQEYVFLTPNSYAQDYINVVVEGQGAVSLDDVPIPSSAFVPISGGQYRVYRTLVQDGAHKLVSDTPVSVIVYGYDKDVSYGYPGGLGLTKL